MSEGSIRVWLAIDPEQGAVRVLMNNVAVGVVGAAGGRITINLAPEYEHLRAELGQYCSMLFANLTDTLRSALYEAPGFATNFAGREAVAALPDERKTRLHLGCGGDVRVGWLNIDYRPGAPIGFDAGAGFLNFDLRQGLPPLADGSVDMIFSSHFFEHLRHEEAVNLMRDCRRVLRPGGVARFQMPDFRGTFRAYVDDDAEFLETCLSTHNLLDHMPDYARNFADVVSRSVYEFYTHKYVWDPENLTKALIAAGFTNVAQEGYSEEFDHPSSVRRDYSYYLTAQA